MLDVPFFPRIPLPTEVLNRPLVDLESGREEVVEPVVSDQLVHRAPDGAFCAGTLTDDGVLNGGAQGVELLVGLLLEQVQGAPLLAIEGGAHPGPAPAEGRPATPRLARLHSGRRRP